MEDSLIRNANYTMCNRDHLHRRVVEQLIQQCTGISNSQHWLLMSLSREQFKSQKEIAARLNISPAAVTMTLKKLESEGYIIKVMNPQDTRFNSVQLTEKGLHAVDISKQLFHDIEYFLFSGFSDEEVLAFTRFTERIIENLHRIESERPFDRLKTDRIREDEPDESGEEVRGS